MKKTTMRLFALAMLMMISMVAEAKIDVQIANDGKFTGGTIVEKSQTDPDEKGLVTVTITVTPDKGYTIKSTDITVVSTYFPSTSTRAPEIAAPLTLLGKDPENLGDPRDYTFIIASTLGVWVKEANFKSESNGGGKKRGTPTEITKLSDITDANEDYIIKSDISGGTVGVTTFNGTLEAAINPETKMPYRIKNLSAPLFTTLTGTVNNLVLENVSISSGDASGNTGAIACTANGAARIYNVGILSGSVGGTGNTGGLVGLLEGTARVINCYSFATITGGSNVGGIVGNNNATTTAASINTMVMNCMFYGDITGGSTVSPVYGGTNIANLQGGLNTFNYYAYDELKTKAISNNKYNSALAVEKKFLNRHEFYRLLLNSNKKLAAFYATGSVADGGQMLKWVLESADRSIRGRDPYPYPVLKEQGYYPSIINIDADNAPSLTLENDKPKDEDRNKGGKLGKTLSVTISMPTTPNGGVGKPDGASLKTENTSLNLTRTDKDFDRFNYNYDKVQLPYYNDVGTGNYTGNKAVTGWMITAITAVSGDPYSASNYPTSGITDYPDHNYADRKSSNKDLYTVSGRVFSQGAYFDVPYGVTSITIEPYWGNAIYVADQYFDVVYKNDYTGKQGVSKTGTQVANNAKFNDQSIKTSITGIGLGTTVYDNAVVLVGNFHLDGVPSNGTTPFTMMSVDEDNDHEPDYSLIYHHKKRLNICPIRFDFLDVIGTAQAQKPNSANLICNFTLCKTRGWFEVTNTALIYSAQFEYENLGNGDNNDNSGKVDAPLILLGGVFDQFVSTQNSDVNGKVYYIHVGGNVWIKEFGMGTHSDGSKSTPHVPVSVTGGEFPGFYLTGTYNANATIRADNAECYISGGYFHEAAGASQEGINGSVQWQIYNADIDNFYGGGTNDAKPIQGDVTVDIYNSHVTTYCGGPKFGNMQTGKKVTTNAEGCHFETYFGAGYGGLSYSRKKYFDATSYNWGNLQKYYYNPGSTTAHENERGKYYDGVTTNAVSSQYGKKGPGVATDFDYEFFVWSSGATGARFFVKFASFSLAQCNDVESNLKKCIIDKNFYGGGSLGKVVGTATSELEDCEVKGNVFAAGYSASLPTVEVRDAGFTKNPNFNSASGMFEPGVFSGTTTFTWKNTTEASVTLENGKSGSDLDNHYLYTNVVLTGLGEVANTNLTITGNTTVGESVYGGGEESGVGGNTSVTVNSGSIGVANTGTFGYRWGNVYGGGKGKITIKSDGSSELTVSSIADLDAGLVKGNTNVTINGTTEKPQILHNVYGGGAVGSVGTFTRDETTGLPTGCAEGTGLATVTINGGTIGHSHQDTGMVNGSSRGWEGNPNGTGAFAYLNQLAWVNETNVIIGESSGNSSGPTIMGSVYGGGENGHNFKNGVVTINRGTIGNRAATWDSGNVYGAGCGTDTYTIGESPTEYHNQMAGIVRETTSITINGGNVLRNVYGGGSMGSVGGGTTTGAGKTTITINGGTIGETETDYGYVFGGPKGNLNETEFFASVRETSVSINADADVKGSVFGGGEAGIVKESVTVNITGGLIHKDVYGGGALANTQTSNWNATGGTWATDKTSASSTTTVSLTGGIISGDAYGGGLGEGQGDTGTPAYVYGDVLVELNNGLNEDDKGCVVNRVFGCNNLNGTPRGKVQVYVYGTQKSDGSNVTDKAEKGTGVFDVQAVYGGGNLAPYEPADALLDYSVEANKAKVDAARSEVYIDGCDRTSIKQVYGGGNAASAPATYVLVNRAYEIDELFGGGNGYDDYSLKEGASTVWYKNPGANVGYYNYTTYPKTEGKGSGTQSDPYQAVENADASTKELRLANSAIQYGSGISRIEVKGGTINTAYGGSNSKGNIRVKASSAYASMFDDCKMSVKQSYGGGKNAPIDGEVDMQADCASGIEEIFGGSENADVDNDINLTISNGTSLKRVFGGNNTSGAINGSITVTIQEGGCEPIQIEELYLGGYLAPYSVYGYETNSDGSYKTELVSYIDENGDTQSLLQRIPKTSGDNPQKDPRIYVISATCIDNIYGGGYQAKLVGNPHINVNMEKGMIPAAHAAGYTGTATTDDAGNKILPIGTIGNIYGGGNMADIIGDTYVEIGTKAWHNASGELETLNRNAANITGNVYGGGNKGAVTGNTNVNICAVNSDDPSTSDVIEYTSVAVSETASESVTIGGNVFGGGKGVEDSYFCAKGMVGRENDGIDDSGNLIPGGTSVIIGNGTVEGSVYGGGEVGRVERNTEVRIGLGDGTGSTISAPDIQGSVFGAGKGVNTHGYAALVRGNTYVTIAGKAKIGNSDKGGSVYGGGEIASVGRYNVAKTDAEVTAAKAQGYDIEKGMPYALKNSKSGFCYVTVKGYAEIGRDNMQMKKTSGPDDTGYVFGAGKGILPYEDLGTEETGTGTIPGRPRRMTPDDKDSDGKNDWEYYTESGYTGEGNYESAYLKYIETLALATKTFVTIGDHAFVKGSVYGGSENGHVQYDTDVKIKDHCQIGAGDGVNTRYDEALFIDPSTDAGAALIETNAATLKECAHWDYGKKNTTTNKMEYLPYDKYVNSEEASTTATDGHTFFGNVFGGGSGLYPYKKPKASDSAPDEYEWLRSAGRVYGNTNVTITGGHILTSVYGGCELTDVGNGVSVEESKGKCTVKMSGGTLGVPRTLDQIAKHPVTCYLFGAGKGDQRTRFNQWTNVGKVEVEVSGGIIYGSVFGGGEDGHVLGNVEITIKKNADATKPDPVIGTWGTSYVDGNVFGAGRGFGGDALTAGVVCGNVDIDILGGNILGSVYGGGRLGSVGTYLVPPTVSASSNDAHPKYGKLIPDGKKVTIDESNWTVIEEDGGGTHGYVTIDISGGTIGNNYEYKVPSNSSMTTAEWKAWKETNHMPKTEFGTSGTDNNRLMHTKGGNVFAGSMGRLYALDDETPLSLWPDLGKARKTIVNISGGTIKSNVYGGGELGTVTDGTKINITGGTIGTEVMNGTEVSYTFGSVYGGGYGSDANLNGTSVETGTTVNTKDHAGLVTGDTDVDVSDTNASGENAVTRIWASVYGGGELALVDGSTDVNIRGSKTKIGKEVVWGEGTANPGYVRYGGYRMGNVYGGGKGSLDYAKAGLIKGNTKVTISSGYVYHNVYGGGALGSVGAITYADDAYHTSHTDVAVGTPLSWVDNTGTTVVEITGGEIGINGWDNGMVNGSSRGDEGRPADNPTLNQVAWVKNSEVTIGSAEGSPKVKGSVYGGGENGHNFGYTKVDIVNGEIGNFDADYEHGNVYGAGCGTDSYTYNTQTYYNPMAGIVHGTSTLTISGGIIGRSVYGGGSMGTTEGKSTVTVTGGRMGSVFGGPKGKEGAQAENNAEFAFCGNDTQVDINYATTPASDDGTTTQLITGSVYGGGEAGSVKGSVAVSMIGGLVLNDVYGGGALADTNTDHTASTPKTTTVSLTGGTISGYAYGGGLGRQEEKTEDVVTTAGIAALVKGDVTVELNKNVEDNARGCVVKQIFGCNNLNGTPQGNVEVHVYKTQRAGATQIVNDGTTITNAKVYGTLKPGSNDFELSSFDVEAVYGGGNQADYIPVTGTNQQTYVVIEGCDRTSIGNVYGGGNAAAVPGTTVLIKGSYELGEVFGGGNGAAEGTRANVGKHTDGTDYTLGEGKAVVQMMAGRVRYVYGGSNTRGDIPGGSIVTNVTNEWTSGNTACCETMQVDHIFGGGKNAEMTGGANIIMGCTNSKDWVAEIFPGAENANIGGNVNLTITSGMFGRVFGGNKTSGKIKGSITVNIEENGKCGIPIIIGELYGGGFKAPYSVYGYDDNDVLLTSGSPKYADPQINVRAFTSIGNIYGGGYGEGADMYGNPRVNINEVEITHTDTDNTFSGNAYAGKTLYFVNEVMEPTRTEDPTGSESFYKVTIHPHADKAMGVVGNVYGGGNAAAVHGDTYVNIGTTTSEALVVLDDTGDPVYTDTDKTNPQRDNPAKPVAGADIRGNVYGGGNKAKVTGDTHVVIGKEATTSSGGDTGGDTEP